MVIGVDAGALSITDDRLKVGVYRVTREALMELVRRDTRNEYRLYTFGAGIRGIVGRRLKEVWLPAMGWSKLWLPLELRKHPVDVFLGFAQSLPPSKTSYNIGFIYDLGFLYHPDAYGLSAKKLKIQTGELIRRADHIITISQATKGDILTQYGVPAETITVTYPGVDPAFSPAGEKYTGARPYFLFVGSLNKAKDIPTLLKSFAGRNKYDLYLIGGDFWPDSAIEETIRTYHLEDRVKILGVVPDDTLAKYYRGAIAFVTTALREGFCLPVAEAMGCGTPVVALDRGALKEVVGEGGIIVRTQMDFIESLVKMTQKKTRNVFSKNAIEQAKKFRWATFARQILGSMHQ